MTAIKELKAVARARGGKGAARAERRAGRVPAVIYGEKQEPVTISLGHKEITRIIYAGHFLTTLFEIDVDGVKHRVIPRDYQLDPVKDLPLHVDFLRVSQGASVTVEVPVHFENQDKAPGLKSGGTLNVVAHAVALECPAEAIPDHVVADLTGLEIGDSLHLSKVKLPAGVSSAVTGDDTLATIVAPSGLKEAEADEAAAAAAAAAKA
ncbi:50S ribosomal protein L25/general stress protein Ctc [Azorhizobium caulinodans]|uniref:Large ribosomal subunit protein bL25 n=1 Tax=Azorhizobium caulinodans (strain ATCC 43989 / DSM 5975 / JCM 20966 / LMG 6465 / NBRC 14845 / NCIMB 13405 / ORS 571) TaxID=438753 RepID=RL25_AZOC5|nr:50S ribosomal protein L25/general stress protein Ctc [Azorhizobium caulinodans]A8HS67.1 RecName: Full=Large ribosomal subunit protein bL25; AltName: Full=50S ribosomal protein L25; AltName: Full=General stress protein CTC [Azorhizobium caulinodans ORS 571]BAF90145.1 ribosomal protein L25 [Azorhizobium caulinodans ORS 571]